MSLSYEQTFSALLHSRMDWKGESGPTHYLPPVPSTCSSTSCFPPSVARPLDGTNLQGQIAFLPRQDQIPETSVVHPQLNKGAYSHPCVILAQQSSFVFCAPVTSFNGQALQEKYARANDKSILWQYLQIHHPAAPREAPNGLGELYLTGDAMAKPSYVNLNGGFWIEWQYLSKFGRSERLALAAESYFIATWAYAVAEQHRQQLTAALACQIARPASPPVAFDEAPYMGMAYFQPTPVFCPPSPPLEGLNAAAAEFNMPSASTDLNPAAANFFVQPQAAAQIYAPEAQIPIYAPIPVPMPYNPYNAWSYSHPPVMVA
ncbi:hypothetical protein HII31_02084 [Pseudocercospora fuligena]|uniref:Uncharacterized protein n=1 Tax=Pseudocercospora fuligena TaxID=685502 RepID=A0A8H6RT35_9PEZI|nr:hypothetical protein HII31_02084 [Pseudocercospora fuligena]